MRAPRLYLRCLGVSIRSQMQYRASFAMQAAGLFLVTAMEFAAIWVLFQRFGSLQGWKLPEVALFYGLAGVSFAVAEALARGFDTFPALVKSGEFDRLLLRPRGTAFQVAARELQLMRVGHLAQGLLVLLWGAFSLDVAWTPAAVLLLAAAAAGGTCIFAGLFVLQATAAFWTVESLELMNTVTYGGVETARYPLTIYRPWFRGVFTFLVPLACMNYFPLHAVLGRPEPLGSPPLWHWLSPAVGPLFLGAALLAWEAGVRRYRSAGS